MILFLSFISGNECQIFSEKQIVSLNSSYLNVLDIFFQVHADSVQDTLTFNLLQELYVHTYMTKRAFSYIWARTPNLRRIKVGNF